MKHRVESSFPRYGHLGIVEAARDLFMQIEGNHGNKGNGPTILTIFFLLLDFPWHVRFIVGAPVNIFIFHFEKKTIERSTFLFFFLIFFL